MEKQDVYFHGIDDIDQKLYVEYDEKHERLYIYWNNRYVATLHVTDSSQIDQ